MEMDDLKHNFMEREDPITMQRGVIKEDVPTTNSSALSTLIRVPTANVNIGINDSRAPCTRLAFTVADEVTEVTSAELGHR